MQLGFNVVYLGFRVYSYVLRICVVYRDLCALAIPFKSYSNGLPFGITLSAQKFQDETLLHVAQLIQDSLGDGDGLQKS